MNKKKMIGVIYLNGSTAVKTFSDHSLVSADAPALASRMAEADIDAILCFNVSEADEELNARALEVMKEICKAVRAELRILDQRIIVQAFRGDRFEHETAGTGAPGVHGIITEGGKIHHIGAGIDLKQGAAKIQSARFSHFDIQKSKCDPVCSCEFNGL